jgi:hypothetical protein
MRRLTHGTVEALLLGVRPGETQVLFGKPVCRLDGRHWSAGGAPGALLRLLLPVVRDDQAIQAAEDEHADQVRKLRGQ